MRAETAATPPPPTGKALADIERQGDTRLRYCCNDEAMELNAMRVLATHRRQRVFVGEAIAGWTLPLAALYLLGSAVAWVRRGFAAE